MKEVYKSTSNIEKRIRRVSIRSLYNKNGFYNEKPIHSVGTLDANDKYIDLSYGLSNLTINKQRSKK